MFSTPESSVHVLDKNREISLLERERKVTGERIWRKEKGSGEKRMVLRISAGEAPPSKSSTIIVELSSRTL